MKKILLEAKRGEAYICKLDVPIRNRKNWQTLLENWIKVMEEYIEVCKEAHKGDVPYWWDENANTGFLAAAAWKMKAVAIEQYSVHRRGESKGHGDLWVTFRGKDGFDFSAEAKISWNSRLKGLEKAVGDSLEEARKQLKKINKQDERGQSQVAFCYWVPETKNKQWKEEFDKENSIEAFKRLGDVVVSYFSQIVPEMKERGYPGIVLIAKIIK